MANYSRATAAPASAAGVTGGGGNAGAATVESAAAAEEKDQKYPLRGEYPYPEGGERDPMLGDQPVLPTSSSSHIPPGRARRLKWTQG